MIWPKRPPLAFTLAETSVAEMSGPKRPRPKCPWPKCPTFHSSIDEATIAQDLYQGLRGSRYFRWGGGGGGGVRGVQVHLS